MPPYVVSKGIVSDIACHDANPDRTNPTSSITGKGIVSHVAGQRPLNMDPTNVTLTTSSSIKAIAGKGIVGNVGI